MPKMSAPRCAAAMCGIKASERGHYRGSGMPADYETGEFGEIARMIRAGAGDDEIKAAHPRWTKELASIRSAVSVGK